MNVSKKIMVVLAGISCAWMTAARAEAPIAGNWTYGMPRCASGRVPSGDLPGVESHMSGSMTFAEGQSHVTMKLGGRYDRSKDGGMATAIEANLAALRAQPAGAERDTQIAEATEQLKQIAQLEAGTECVTEATLPFTFDGQILSLGKASSFTSTCEGAEAMGEDIKFAVTTHGADRIDLSPVDPAASDGFCGENDRATITIERVKP